MGSETVDDLSSLAAEAPAAPAILMVASAHRPAAMVFAANATLGRSTRANGVTHELPDERMSKEHATVRRERGGWTITDLESRNGTFVDGERLHGSRHASGDVIVRLGHTVFVLLADGRGHPVTSGEMVEGPELQRAYNQIRAHAATDTLLVHGESGSGKELAARLYHQAGPRAQGPFVAINCAAIPEGVAERLLFGARRGAFSGAVDAVGHFQMAHGGTLFLDEIADLEASVQAKLLRVLETREVVPVGATTGTAISVGIVAASHRELRAAVAERRFREDLYYRIARTTIHLPAIRDRKVDLARLVEREILAVDPKLGAHAKLVEACCIRPWPGNVRELRSAIRQAAISAVAAGRELVRVEDLAAYAGLPIDPAITPTPPTMASPLEVSKEAVVAALARANGVISVAARILGLHRTQLYRLMDRLEVARGDDT
jgi:transcriptional regulator with PAS, ATPase and Fis domain